MTADHHGLPTPRSTLAASYVVVLVWCKSCRHQAQADLQRLIDAGKGDVPLTRLRFRCTNCHSSLTDFVCTGRTAVGCSRGSVPRRADSPVIGLACQREMAAGDQQQGVPIRVGRPRCDGDGVSSPSAMPGRLGFCGHFPHLPAYHSAGGRLCVRR